MSSNFWPALIGILIIALIGYFFGWLIAKWRFNRKLKKIQKGIPQDLLKEISEYKSDEKIYLNDREVKQNGRQKSGLIEKPKDRRIDQDNSGESGVILDDAGESATEESDISGESEEGRDIQDEPSGEPGEDDGETGNKIARHIPSAL